MPFINKLIEQCESHLSLHSIDIGTLAHQIGISIEELKSLLNKEYVSPIAIAKIDKFFS